MIKYSIQEVKEIFINNELFPLFYEYKNATLKLPALNSQGYKIVSSLHNLLKGREPLSFSILNPYSIENIKLYMKMNQINYELLSTKFESACKHKLKWKCDKGHEFEISWNSFQSGRRCPYCFRMFKKSDEQFKSEVFDLVGNDYEVLSRYNNDRTKVTMKHVRCEYQYEVTPSHFLQGRRCPNCSVRRGVFNNKYNPKLTENDRINRRVKYGKSIIEWRSQVYKKDNYTCQHCSAQGNYLNAHHINGYNWYEAGRFDVNNGATLCRECHKLFHKIYGHGYNTKEQFEDFLKNKAII